MLIEQLNHTLSYFGSRTSMCYYVAILDVDGPVPIDLQEGVLDLLRPLISFVFVSFIFYFCYRTTITRMTPSVWFVYQQYWGGTNYKNPVFDKLRAIVQRVGVLAQRSGTQVC